MSHTTPLFSDDGRQIGCMIHNSDFSGDVIIQSKAPPNIPSVPVRLGEAILTGEIIQAIRRSALYEAQEALEQLVELIGLPRQEPERKEP